MRKRKVITISLNNEEYQMLKQMGDKLGIVSHSAIVKACIKWGDLYVERFEKSFSNVITPLKHSEIDMLIHTLSIKAKQHKRQEKETKPIEL